MMPIISFRVDDEVYRMLKEKAESSGMTLSDYMRVLVQKHLNNTSRGKGQVSIEDRLKALEERLKRLEHLIAASKAYVSTPSNTSAYTGPPLEGLPSYFKDNPWLEILRKRPVDAIDF